MTELDLDLKVASRRLLWKMGHSTRIDVVLRAARTAPGGARGRSASPESFTDLDVLGVSVLPNGRVNSSIVDCKTGGSSIITRLFWLRGLSEFFDADDAYMVRDRDISRDAGQLANRLGLTAFSDKNVLDLEQLYPSSLPLESGHLSKLFDAAYIAKVMHRTTGLDKRLNKLLEYRQFEYWVLPEYRNLIEVVTALKGVNSVLDGRSPLHTGLILDFAWLYVLSLARCIGHLRTVHIGNLKAGLTEYLAGGVVQLSQKQDLAMLLERLKDSQKIPATVRTGVNPPYFEGLLELVVRLQRRTDVLTSVLRILEFQTTVALGGDKVPAADAFGAHFDRVGAKLAYDVVAFLVEAADLDPKFAETIKALLSPAPPAPEPSQLQVRGRPEVGAAMPSEDVPLSDVTDPDAEGETSGAHDPEARDEEGSSVLDGDGDGDGPDESEPNMSGADQSNTADLDGPDTLDATGDDTGSAQPEPGGEVPEALNLDAVEVSHLQRLPPLFEVDGEESADDKR